MNGPYDDIIHLPHHTSPTRKRMSMADRAAQFSPFAALTGHDAAIQETARYTDAPIDLATDGTAILNEKLRYLAEHQQEQPQILVSYYVPDERKPGGAYVTLSGTVRAVVPQEQTIYLADGSELYFSRIYQLESPVFRDIWP